MVLQARTVAVFSGQGSEGLWLWELFVGCWHFLLSPCLSASPPELLECKFFLWPQMCVRGGNIPYVSHPHPHSTGWGTFFFFLGIESNSHTYLDLILEFQWWALLRTFSPVISVFSCEAWCVPVVQRPTELVRRCSSSEKLKGVSSIGTQLRNYSFYFLLKRTGKFVQQQVYTLLWFVAEVFHCSLVIFCVIGSLTHQGQQKITSAWILPEDCLGFVFQTNNPCPALPAFWRDRQ